MIRISIQTFMLVVLALLLIAIVILQSIMLSKMMKAMRISQSSNNSSSLQLAESNISHSPSVQSDFFKRSIAVAENVIKGNEKQDDYAKSEKPGHDIVSAFLYLSEAEKHCLLSSMNYYQSDPFIYSETEKEFRKISAQTKIPLWIVIIKDAMEKANLLSVKTNLRVVSIAS